MPGTTQLVRGAFDRGRLGSWFLILAAIGEPATRIATSRLLLACLVVPFILGLVWRKGHAAAALVSIVVGLTVRLVLFVMTPTMYGLDNTILYIPNGVFDASFDGWPTFIAFAASLVTYVAVALVTPVAPIRGLDVRVAEDLDDALGEVDTAEPEPELVKADAGPRLPTAP
jgi:SSS family solute:Na+ symporter